MIVAITLAHLLAINCRAPWPRRCGFAGSGIMKFGPSAPIELDRDVARDFHMLLLIKPHGHHIGVVDQDVRRHEHRICKEAEVG